MCIRDRGKSDHRVSPVTWNSTIKPLPRRAAVTSGVPSASVDQVLSLSVASGSAKTWRVTVTSFGTGMPLNGLSRENAASGCGLSQLKLPPRMRPPRRSLTAVSYTHLDVYKRQVYFNRRVSRRDHVALYIVRSFRQTAPPQPNREIVAHGFFATDALPADTSRATRERIAEVLTGRPPAEIW